VHGVTVPLVTASDGTKFGKSTGGGSLWLDPEMTSPYTWYQYFLNTADADVVRYLRWFSFLGREEIDELDAATRDAPHQRAAQKRLAEEMTTLVHGVAATESVQAASRALFGRGEEGVLGSLDESTLAAALEDAGAVSVEPGEPSGIIDLLVATGLSESRGAARRAVSEGGAYVNNERISDPEWEPQRTDLLHGGWLVLRRGKKSFAGVRFLRAGPPRSTLERRRSRVYGLPPGDLRFHSRLRNLLDVAQSGPDREAGPTGATRSQKSGRNPGLTGKNGTARLEKLPREGRRGIHAL